MKNLVKMMAVAIIAIGIFGCAAKKEMKAYYGSEYNVEAQIVKVGQDGTKLVKVWGTGKNVELAIIHAKRNAISAALFQGFAAGGGSAKIPALVTGDSQTKNKAFFDDFFKDGGKYLQYVDDKTDGMPSGKDRIKLSKGYKVAITASIQFDSLRKYLEDKGVARKLNSGF